VGITPILPFGPVYLMENAVSQTVALFDLQVLDLQADDIRRRLAEIAALLGQGEAIQTAQSTLAQAEDRLLHHKTRVTDLELDRTRLKSEADAAEKRLYSGRVLNPRELTELRDKVDELRRRHTALDDPLLEAMLELDDSQAAVEEAQATLQRITAEQASAASALTTEQSTLQAQLAEVEARAAQAQAAVQPDHLATYHSLRQRLGGLAVAQVRDEECQACGVRLNSSLVQQARHGSIKQCTTCERILYVV
jgi:predicted  nucleic acid-binding Zn-ribbon protein